jgi:hypothetical protein
MIPTALRGSFSIPVAQSAAVGGQLSAPPAMERDCGRRKASPQVFMNANGRGGQVVALGAMNGATRNADSVMAEALI